MPIIIIPIVVIIVLLVLGYTKAPPNKAAVITGLRGQEPMTKVTGLCFTSSDLTK